MTIEEITQKVLDFLNESSDRDEKSISHEHSIRETNLLDSLTVLETVMFLETEFGLQLDRADLDSLRTPSGIVDLIVQKQNGL